MSLTDTWFRLCAIPFLSAVASVAACNSKTAIGLDLPEPALEVARIEAIWDGWKSKATSVDIAGFQFVGAVGSDSSGPTRDEIVKLFRSDLPDIVRLNAGDIDIQLLEAATAPLFAGVTRGTIASPAVGRWGRIAILRDGANSRLDLTMGGHSRSTVRRGTTEQTYSSGAQQASIYTAHGPLEIPASDMFVFVPPSVKAKVVRWSIQMIDPNTTQLTGHGERGATLVIEYDSVSGFVKYYGVSWDANRFVQERFQSDPVLTPSGIPIGRTICELRYDSPSDLPTSAVCYVVTSSQVEGAIDEQRFNLGVPAGTTVVEFDGADGMHVPPSEGGKEPRIATVTEPVEDAEMFSKSPAFTETQSGRLSSRSPADLHNAQVWWQYALIIINAVVLLVLASYAVAVRRRSARK